MVRETMHLAALTRWRRRVAKILRRHFGALDAKLEAERPRTPPSLLGQRLRNIARRRVRAFNALACLCRALARGRNRTRPWEDMREVLRRVLRLPSLQRAEAWMVASMREEET